MQNTPPGLGSTDEHIGFTGQIVPRELEFEYRRQQFGADLSIARIVLLVNGIGVLLFVASDYRLFGSNHPFPLLFALRLTLVAYSAAVWKVLGSAAAALNPRRFDLALLFLCIVMALSQVYVGATRPATYTGHFLVHLVTVLLLYVAVPLPLRFQAFPAMLMSTGMAFCMWLKPPQDGLTIQAVTWTLIGVNVLGWSVSRQLQVSKRGLFIAHRHEVAARKNLEEALRELKTLRGIIPICAHCKSVRGDAGAWEQLEMYVMRHSDAEFSHGICPVCIDEHFKDFSE